MALVVGIADTLRIRCEPVRHEGRSQPLAVIDMVEMGGNPICGDKTLELRVSRKEGAGDGIRCGGTPRLYAKRISRYLHIDDENVGLVINAVTRGIQRQQDAYLLSSNGARIREAAAIGCRAILQQEVIGRATKGGGENGVIYRQRRIQRLVTALNDNGRHGGSGIDD